MPKKFKPLLKIPDEKIEAALKANHGLLTQTAEALGIAPQTLKSRLNHNLRLKQVMIDATEIISDLAESNLIAAIKSGNPYAMKLWLSAKARDRGWGQQQINATQINVSTEVRVEDQKKRIKDSEKLLLELRGGDIPADNPPEPVHPAHSAPATG